MPKKLKAGFFSLSCCEGCSLVFFDLEEKMLKALGFIEIVDARLFDGNHPNEKLDLAIVEGGVQSERDKRALIAIRERSAFLVGFGACATIAGIPGIRNALPGETRTALKKKAIVPIKERVFPIGSFVRVDYLMQGCPVFSHELFDVLVKLHHGIAPRLEEIAVCKECREKENPCLLLGGEPCLGPVAYAGCRALCPSENAPCIACRGFTQDGNFASLREIFRKNGVSEQEIGNLFTYFTANPFDKKEKGRD
jgi:sulfhydrogenase subunit delta